jgi:hypothetical protein
MTLRYDQNTWDKNIETEKMIPGSDDTVIL